MKLTLPPSVQNIIGLLNWKVGPDVLPKSQLLLAVCLGAFAAAVFLRQAMDYSLARAAASGIGSAVILGAVAFLCAKVSGYQERLTQTLCALALGGAIIIFLTTFLLSGVIGHFGEWVTLYQCCGAGELPAVSAICLECLHIRRFIPEILPSERDCFLCNCVAARIYRRFLGSDCIQILVAALTVSGTDFRASFLAGAGARRRSRVTRFCTVTLPLGSGAMSGLRNE